ncbi:MAG TPA: HIT domain-containing protein [Desulfopila sp.]|nr:HIT domain-containing protein [Desulfopila sp.]
MKTLWTPWRMEYVKGKVPSVSGCLFEPPGSGRRDREHLLLYRNETVVVLLNRFPYAHGHLLIAPRRHIATLVDLEANEAQALMDMVQKCTDILGQLLSCDGFNIGCNIGEIAGAGVADHLHFHVVPRWQGDHNYMAVVAEIRTIPEHLENTYDVFVEKFDRL